MTDDGVYPLHVAGLPLGMVAAMLQGISRRYPHAAWVDDSRYSGDVMAIRLGPEHEDDPEDP